MNPNQGYMLKAATGGTLTYPDLGNFWPGTPRGERLAAFSKVTGTPQWSIDPSKFEHTMNLTSQLLINGVRSEDPAGLVGIFAGTECRGVGTPIMVDGHATYFLTAFANTEHEQLTIKAFTSTMDSAATALEVIDFTADGIIGDPLKPFAIHVSTGTSAVGGALPTVLTLEQNYPNPFNPSTSITYTLPRDGQVTLTVYDMLGNEVAQLVNKRQGAGRHSAIFDATGLESGQYVYRLQSGGVTLSKVMTLVK